MFCACAVISQPGSLAACELLTRMRGTSSDNSVSSLSIFCAASEQRPAPFHEGFSTAIVTLRVITITKSDYDTFIIYQDVANGLDSVRNGCGAK